MSEMIQNIHKTTWRIICSEIVSNAVSECRIKDLKYSACNGEINLWSSQEGVEVFHM